MFRNVCLLFLVVCLLPTEFTLGGDWPHWRGPFLNGGAQEDNLPVRWGETEGIAWVSPVPGHSGATAVIAGGRVYVSSTDRGSPDLLGLCFDVKTGKEFWRRKLGSCDRKVPRNNLASSSPVTDGENVYFMFGSGDLAGLSRDGEILWRRNIEAEYGNISIKYGYSSSPLLYDNKLYILIQRRHTSYREPESSALDAFILAVDPKTGKNFWKQPRITDAVDESLDSYSSPIIFEHNGRSELIIVGADYATGNDAESGRELWRYGYAIEKSQRWRNIASAVTGDGLIYGVRPRSGNGLFAIKAGGEGTLPQSYVAWMFNGPTPDVCTPLYYKGSVYVLDGGSRKTLSCLDGKTGKLRWQGKLGGRGAWRASVTAADDKLYCINESSEAIVLAADPKEFRIISRIDMNDGPVQASIAIADGHLFIRTSSRLFCVGQ